MKLFNSWRKCVQVLGIGMTVLRLPIVHLRFNLAIAPSNIRAIFAAFTKPHARYRLIKSKTMGIALIDLRKFNSSADYLATVKRKDYAGHHARMAARRGYTVRPINRNDFIDDIFKINTSATARQGRPMDAQYRMRQTEYDESAPWQCFGVFHADGRLMGYCSFGVFGNFAGTNRLLGYKNRDGAMYLLLLEIICLLIDEGRTDFFMYDTFLGANEGLQSFKRRIGFQPYRARYSIE